MQNLYPRHVAVMLKSIQCANCKKKTKFGSHSNIAKETIKYSQTVQQSSKDLHTNDMLVLIGVWFILKWQHIIHSAVNGGGLLEQSMYPTCSL